MNDLIWVIIGMSLVTLIPRWLPIWIVGRVSLPRWANQWLNHIPYAALGALIFPGILSIEQGKPLIGLLGGLIAGCLAFFRLHIMYVIFGAILTVFIAKNFL
nr:AzlD domain-containing protein [Thermoflavimicrobium dichotomicum]